MSEKRSFSEHSQKSKIFDDLKNFPVNKKPLKNNH